jgi:L-lactate dehydrogenase complex protein LldE
MTIGLFIPCFINQFYPKVGIATLKLLRSFGYDVRYPIDQTCCGQSLANSGYQKNTKKIDKHFDRVFDTYDTIVAPAGSCIYYIKTYSANGNKYRARLFELSEFLIKQNLPDQITSSYPRKVGILNSCHGLRGLQLGKSTELAGDDHSTLTTLLSKVKDLKMIRLDRTDECCGFGGTFSIKEPELSVKMGRDRLNDFIKNGAEVITATDVSCLMHLDGIIRKDNYPLETRHFSEILYPS